MDRENLIKGMFWNDLVERKIFIFKFLYEMSLEWSIGIFEISEYSFIYLLMRIIYRWCSHHAWFSIAFQTLIRKESVERRKRVFSTLFLPFLGGFLFEPFSETSLLKFERLVYEPRKNGRRKREVEVSISPNYKFRIFT